MLKGENTGMTVVEYLNQAKWLREKIRFDIQEKNYLRQMADGVAAPRTDMEKVQTSPMGEAPYAALLQKIRDLELAICEEVERMLELRKQVREVIASLHDNELEMILNYCYLNGMGWEEISMEMHMDRSTIKRKHDKAVESIVLPEDAIAIRKS